MIELIQGDCLEKMAELKENSVDSIVTDPPYGLFFMGKKWDYEIPGVDIWKQCLRVLKPGGYLLSFAGTRTQHRMACNIEDAGFEIRDMITELVDTNQYFSDFVQSLNPDQLKTFSKFASCDGLLGWGYGSGFPKSLNISKAIDKESGEPQKTNYIPNFKNNDYGSGMGGGITDNLTRPNSLEARKWEGWGTALKPALEPITVARKPLAEKTVAENVLKHGTGGINIDGCRIEMNKYDKEDYIPNRCGWQEGVNYENPDWDKEKGVTNFSSKKHSPLKDALEKGRWPANLIHDGSPEVLALFPEVHGAGYQREAEMVKTSQNINFKGEVGTNYKRFGDSGSASRFFYCAKASKYDRDIGLYGLENKKKETIKTTTTKCRNCNKIISDIGRNSRPNSFCSCTDKREPFQAIPNHKPRKNIHPTVKPTDLMQYLCRLVTPKEGTILDPFMGSGSTGRAAKLEGFNFIGIELDQDYFNIAKQRIDSILAVQPEIDWGAND